jgi:hypothetical protein
MKKREKITQKRRGTEKKRQRETQHPQLRVSEWEVAEIGRWKRG